MDPLIRLPANGIHYTRVIKPFQARPLLAVERFFLGPTALLEPWYPLILAMMVFPVIEILQPRIKTSRRTSTMGD
jgi:hypothetical protein